jgi:transposase
VEYARALVAQGEAGVNQVCQLMGISKKSYYQSQEPQERLAEKYQALRPVLGRLIEQHPSYGVPRLKKALAEQEGMVVNPKLLRKLLRIWGLTWHRTAGAGQRKKTWVQRVIDSLVHNHATFSGMVR